VPWPLSEAPRLSFFFALNEKPSFPYGGSAPLFFLTPGDTRARNDTCACPYFPQAAVEGSQVPEIARVLSSRLHLAIWRPCLRLPDSAFGFLATRLARFSLFGVDFESRTTRVADRLHLGQPVLSVRRFSERSCERIGVPSGTSL